MRKLGITALTIALFTGLVPLAAHAQSEDSWQSCRYIGVQRADRSQVECDDGVGYILFDFNGLHAYTYDPASPDAGSTDQPWILVRPHDSTYVWLWLDVNQGKVCGLSEGSHLASMGCSKLGASTTPSPTNTAPPDTDSSAGGG